MNQRPLGYEGVSTVHSGRHPTERAGVYASPFRPVWSSVGRSTRKVHGKFDRRQPSSSRAPQVWRCLPPGTIGSCLGPVASGEPGEAPLPVRLRAGSRPSGSALPPRCSAVHPRPPQPPWPLAGAPVAGGWVPDSIGRGQGARDRDHEPAAQGGNPLSPGSPDRRDPGLSRGGRRVAPTAGHGAAEGSWREIALARSGSMGTAGFGPWTR